MYIEQSQSAIDAMVFEIMYCFRYLLILRQFVVDFTRVAMCGIHTVHHNGGLALAAQLSKNKNAPDLQNVQH